MNRFPGRHCLKPHPDLEIHQVPPGVGERNLIHVAVQTHCRQDFFDNVNGVVGQGFDHPGINKPGRACQGQFPGGDVGVGVKDLHAVQVDVGDFQKGGPGNDKRGPPAISRERKRVAGHQVRARGRDKINYHPFFQPHGGNAGHGNNPGLLPGIAAVNAPSDPGRADFAGGFDHNYEINILIVGEIPGHYQSSMAGAGLGHGPGIGVNSFFQVGPAFIIPGHERLPGPIRGRGPDDSLEYFMNQQAGKYLGLVFAGEGIADIPEIPDPPHILQDPLGAAGRKIKAGVDVDLPAVPDAVGNQEVGVARLPLVPPVVQGQDMSLAVYVAEISGAGGNQVAAVDDIVFVNLDGGGQAAPLDHRFDPGRGTNFFALLLCNWCRCFHRYSWPIVTISSCSLCNMM